MGKIFMPVNGFLDMTLNTWATKGKKDKLDFIKINNFCVTEDIIKEMERDYLQNGRKWKPCIQYECSMQSTHITTQ